MREPAFPVLFSALQLGPIELRNRIVLSAMTTGFGFDRGAPTGDLLAYLAPRTRDVGMAVVAFGAVTPEGRVEQKIPWMWREDAANMMAPLAAAISATGAVPCLQLGHGGRQVSPLVIGTDPVAPSAVPPAVHVPTPPRELDSVGIERIIAAFSTAASRAADAGFGAIEVHAAHGYLIHQFLSPGSNTRDDEYGVDRALFGARVIEAVCAAAPELAITVRINGDDLTPGGMTPDTAAVVAARFAAAGAHAVTVSAGVYGSVPYTIPLLDDPEGIFLSAAATVKAAVGVPVIGVGRITDPRTAERAIAGGQCDAVAIGRALLADPEWVEKARAGRTASIRPCIATVQGCAGMLQHGDPISCTVNPEVGREGRTPATTSRRIRVTVVGAGPAGMEAARRAAELGHEVRLLEQRSQIGGALRLAAATPPLTHLENLLRWYERELAEASVDIVTGVAPDLPTSSPDSWTEVIVAATGATTTLPVIDGYDNLPAWTLEDLLSGLPSSLGTTGHPTAPIIAGGGQRALSLALWCAAGGSRPTLLAPDTREVDTSGLARRAFLARLDAARIPIAIGSPAALSTDGVIVGTESSATLVAGDALVLADPVRSVSLKVSPAGGAPVVMVGDARNPRGIGPAIAEGRDAAERLHELVG